MIVDLNKSQSLGGEASEGSIKHSGFMREYNVCNPTLVIREGQKILEGN